MVIEQEIEKCQRLVEDIFKNKNLYNPIDEKNRYFVRQHLAATLENLSKIQDPKIAYDYLIDNKIFNDLEIKLKKALLSFYSIFNEEISYFKICFEKDTKSLNQLNELQEHYLNILKILIIEVTGTTNKIEIVNILKSKFITEYNKNYLNIENIVSNL